MQRNLLVTKMMEEGIMGIVRLPDPIHVNAIVRALLDGGIRVIEVTAGTPGAFRIIEELRAEHPSLLIGAGSVIDTETASLAIRAGARFVVTPVSKRSVIHYAHRYDVPVFSGAFSPKEIVQAFEWGADVIKLFPAHALGVPFLKALQGPLPQIPIMPTGGINEDNIAAWGNAGACMVGIGGTFTTLDALSDSLHLTMKAKALKEQWLRSRQQASATGSTR